MHRQHGVMGMHGARNKMEGARRLTVGVKFPTDTIPALAGPRIELVKIVPYVQI